MESALIRPSKSEYLWSSVSLAAVIDRISWSSKSPRDRWKTNQFGMLPSALPEARRILNASISLIVVVSRGMSELMAWSGIKGGIGGFSCEIIDGGRVCMMMKRQVGTSSLFKDKHCRRSVQRNQISISDGQKRARSGRVICPTIRCSNFSASPLTLILISPILTNTTACRSFRPEVPRSSRSYTNFPSDYRPFQPIRAIRRALPCRWMFRWSGRDLGCGD